MRTNTRIGVLGVGIFAVGLTILLFAVQNAPGYFANTTYLSSLIFLEIVLATVWHYEKLFFAVLMWVFLTAGTSLPLNEAAGKARWVFLFVGAFVGLLKWARSEQKQRFYVLHLVALFCVLLAALSASVSNRPEMSLLKSASLFLLFLYGACGARVAIAGRERIFFRWLVTVAEGASFLLFILYSVGYNVFGNPNNLGAALGTIIIPILLWGIVIGDRRVARNRRTLALCLAGFLLYTSQCRAGMLASAVAFILLCVTLHRKKLLFRGALAFVFLTTLVGVVQPNQFDTIISSFTTKLLYKEQEAPDAGVFKSRQTPWQGTLDAIKSSPWLGQGFGTDATEGPSGRILFATPDSSVREHGNSYLALVNYLGLIGSLPFAILLCIVLGMIFHAFGWIWQTRNPDHYAVPLALICTAGLVHAFFEDWLFAVGSYLSVYFWVSSFILAEIQPRKPRQALNLAQSTEQRDKRIAIKMAF